MNIYHEWRNHEYIRTLYGDYNQYMDGKVVETNVKKNKSFDGIHI
jgi:hypothetical protein